MGKNKTVGCGCDYCMGRGIRRDFRHGALGDGWEDTPYRSPRAGKKKKQRAGCPENDGGPHVYIWIRDTWWDGFIDDVSYHYEQKVCCGCGKRASGKRSYRKVYNED